MDSIIDVSVARLKELDRLSKILGPLQFGRVSGRGSSLAGEIRLEPRLNIAGTGYFERELFFETLSRFVGRLLAHIADCLAQLIQLRLVLLIERILRGQSVHFGNQ